MTLALMSPNFRNNGEIPTLHTCEGKDVSPALAWSGAPAATKSYALIVDDPDAPDPKAPKGPWVHWILYNLPPSTTGLAQGVPPASLPPGTKQGINDWKKTGYGGPCPPVGKHRYFHRLYALDDILSDLGTTTKKELEKAMKPHLLAKASLVGTYAKKTKG